MVLSIMGAGKPAEDHVHCDLLVSVLAAIIDRYGDKAGRYVLNPHTIWPGSNMLATLLPGRPNLNLEMIVRDIVHRSLLLFGEGAGAAKAIIHP